MTGYRVDNQRRITLPESNPGEVYDVELLAPGVYRLRLEGQRSALQSGKAAIEGLEDAAPDEAARL